MRKAENDSRQIVTTYSECRLQDAENSSGWGLAGRVLLGGFTPGSPGISKPQRPKAEV